MEAVTKKIFFVISATVLIVSYQNCSRSGFKQIDAVELPSVQAIEAPKLSFSYIVPELTNVRNHDVKIVFLYDKRLTIKSITCKLDAQAAANCASLTYSLIGLADGDHSLLVKGEDSDGQKVELLANFRVDGTAPTVTLTSTPPATTSATTAQFTFTSADNLSGVDKAECALDGALYSECTSPVNLSSLAVQDHVMKIRAKDKAGNTGQAKTHNWTVQ